MSNLAGRTLASAVLLALCSVPPAVYAQATYEFDLPAQPLANTLRAVGARGGVDIAFAPETVQGRNAPAIKGRYSVRDALQRVLAGSGLVVQTTPGGSFVIQPPNAPRATTQAFQLPAQSLGDTLKAIGDETGHAIRVDESVTVGKTAAPVQGVMTPLQAVEAALQGTGLRAYSSADGTVTVLAAGAKSPPSAGNGNVHVLDEITVTAKFEGLSATRVPTELREIPQSVSLISQNTLQQQNAHDLDTALNHATGITVNRQSTQTMYYSRGFAIGAIHVDGSAPLGANSLGLDDLSEYDHIEVLRGADALFGGAGDPGATLNLVRKRPLAQNAAEMVFNLGSWNNHRLQFDATGPLGLDGALRGRVVASAGERDYFYDNADRNHGKLYGILEYDLSPATMLTLGGSFERANAHPFAGGLPRYDNGADPHLPRDTAFVFAQNREDTTSKEVFAQLDQKLGERWKLKAGATLFDQSSSSFQIANQTAINPATGLIDTTYLTGNDMPSKGRQISAEVTLTGSWDWQGRPQELVIGGDYLRNLVPTLSSSTPMVSGPPLDPWHFDPGAYSVLPASASSPVFVINSGAVSVTGMGLYASLRLRPWNGGSVILGARDNYLKTHTGAETYVYDMGPDGSMDLGGSPALNTFSTGVVTPYAGVVQDLNKHYSLYASYTEIYRPNYDKKIYGGGLLGPVRGDNMEAGIKGTWRDGRVNASLAAFKIRQRNVPTQDFLHFSEGDFYVPSDNSSKGVEAEVSGALTDNWQFNAGYTFNINHTLEGLSAEQLAAYGETGPTVMTTFAPKHLLKVWTDYRLPGSWSAWSIGGGFNAQSGIYVDGYACTAHDATGCTGDYVPFKIRQGGYVLAFLRVAYVINSQWSAALNINNLLDRRYYQTVGPDQYGNWYGAPRGMMLTVTGTF